MTKATELFTIWAPASARWSRWAKPALFAQSGQKVYQHEASERRDASSLMLVPDYSPATAVIVELPAAQSVAGGLALARSGFRPVPLFNCSIGPDPVRPNAPLIIALTESAEALRQISIDDNAAPAFLLDSERLMPVFEPTAGRFDNRWIVFPQDFPSGGYLVDCGISKIVVLQSGREVARDLVAVLLRWKKCGIEFFHCEPGDSLKLTRLPVKRASWTSAIADRLWSGQHRLRRNSAGAFGAIIPNQSPSGGG